MTTTYETLELTKKFTLTIDNGEKMIQKNFNTFEEAFAVVKRAIPLYRRNQAYFNGVSVLNYISIDETMVDNNGNVRDVVDYTYYFCGDKMRIQVLGM